MRKGSPRNLVRVMQLSSVSDPLRLIATATLCRHGGLEKSIRESVGYFIAPLTANYSFYVAGDDYVQLSLSADDSFANLLTICESTRHTPTLLYSPEMFYDQVRERKRLRGRTYKGTNRALFADFRRFSLILPFSLENKAFGKRRFSQKTTDFRRNPQKTADCWHSPKGARAEKA